MVKPCCFGMFQPNKKPCLCLLIYFIAVMKEHDNPFGLIS